MSDYDNNARRITALNNAHHAVWNLLTETLPQETLGSLNELHKSLIEETSVAQQNPNDTKQNAQLRKALLAFYKETCVLTTEDQSESLEDVQKLSVQEFRGIWKQILAEMPNPLATSGPQGDIAQELYDTIVPQTGETAGEPLQIVAIEILEEHPELLWNLSPEELITLRQSEFIADIDQPLSNKEPPGFELTSNDGLCLDSKVQPTVQALVN